MGPFRTPLEPRLPPAPAPIPFARAVLGAAVAIATLAPAPAGAAPTGRPALDAQAARVKGLEGQKHRPAYAEAQLALAALRRGAGDLKGALAAAREAAAAFDAQVELHKALSDALPVYDDARAERAAALALGLRRDEAFFQVAELARATGDEALAVRHYVLLVQSQADQPRGREAYAALRKLGWAASPAPAGGPPAPVPTPSPVQGKP